MSILEVKFESYENRDGSIFNSGNCGNGTCGGGNCATCCYIHNETV